MSNIQSEVIQGFDPIEAADAKILILGSMPGVPSLTKDEYYGNPQNSFWRIMAELIGFSTELEYVSRVQCLIEHRIAVWDVIGECRRTGSLDSNIVPDSIIVNDFSSFFMQHSEVSKVFCNGGRAFKEFNKRVAPTLLNRQVDSVQLLSTSPANARYNYAEKLENWSTITAHL